MTLVTHKSNKNSVTHTLMHNACVLFYAGSIFVMHRTAVSANRF